MSELTLGAVTFDGWEIPGDINFGGQQQLVTHKLIGGQRIVEAMGPDPDNIRWRGRFRGPDALGRAQAVDAMRQAGAAVPLTWGGLFYMVVIQHFKPSYEKGWEIPYEIECVVSGDPFGAGVGAIGGLLAGDLGGLIGGDLAQVAGMINGVLNNPVSFAMNAIGGAVNDAVGSALDGLGF